MKELLFHSYNFIQSITLSFWTCALRRALHMLGTSMKSFLGHLSDSLLILFFISGPLRQGTSVRAPSY